jgi:hypothetical protein
VRATEPVIRGEKLGSRALQFWPCFRETQNKAGEQASKSTRYSILRKLEAVGWSSRDWAPCSSWVDGGMVAGVALDVLLKIEISRPARPLIRHTGFEWS